MNRASIILLIALLPAPACGGKHARPDQPATLVTRKSEPVSARPTRLSAVRTDLGDETEQAIDAMLVAESASNEVVLMTGLTWADGHKSVAVSHVHFPPHDMTESEFEATTDAATLERCDNEFADCVDGAESCQEEAYESCIRSAYRNPFVYMSSHLGIDCGILEVSMYGVNGTQVTLLERRTLDPMVCDYDYAETGPSAADLDGDGGPELVYTWSSSRDDGWRPDEQSTESIVIMDANDFTEQFRFTQNAVVDDYDDRENITGVTTQDPDGDGFFDLRTSFVKMTGYCSGYGWALDARFVLPEDASVDDPACQIQIEQHDYAYDVVHDTWSAPATEPGS